MTPEYSSKILKIAKRNLKAAQGLLKIECEIEAAHCIKQGFMRILKYQLYCAGCGMPIRIDNLTELVNMLRSCSYDIYVPDEIIKLALKVSSWDISDDNDISNKVPTFIEVTAACNTLEDYIHKIEFVRG